MLYDYAIRHGIKVSELLKDVDKILPDENDAQIFLPKPFVFEDMINTNLTKVYLPGQTYDTFMDGLGIEQVKLCMCVHMCEQFFDYPTTKWGIRVIPSNAKCPLFGGRCTGARLVHNNKTIDKSINMKYSYIAGLSKPQKTK